MGNGGIINDFVFMVLFESALILIYNSCIEWVKFLY